MDKSENEAVLVTGAAGFIGSHLTDRLLAMGWRVVGVDNLSRGTRSNLSEAFESPRFHFVEGDLTNAEVRRTIFSNFGIDTVWHMTANSDIGAGVADASVDLRDTFLTTFHLLEAMRDACVGNIVFASSSAVYGVHDEALREDTGPLLPISNYGAMKLASEALISAAVESYLKRAWIFRFPNVIGPRATHGIIFDLLTKLETNPADLEVLGDGRQQKPYLHVSELIEAMLWIEEHAGERLTLFNIGPKDEGVTVRAIAEAVREDAAPNIPLRFTGGGRGWVGDVQRFRYSIEKLRALGWEPRLSSAEAVARAVKEIHAEFRLANSCSL
jgi:UDP-glucose 4-epimerase